MYCSLLVSSHFMVGVDGHALAPPAEPAPPPPVPVIIPHAVAAPSLVLILGAKFLPTVLCQGTPTMLRGTDIGMGIPHAPIPPGANPLAFLIPLNSGSKSMFGSSSVLTSQGPVALAAGSTFNLNFNCGDVPFAARFSGLVLAPNTVLANMTLADLISGCLFAALDEWISQLMNLGVGKLTGYLRNKLQAKVSSQIVQSIVKRVKGKVIPHEVHAKVVLNALEDVAKRELPNTVNWVLGRTLNAQPLDSLGLEAQRTSDALAEYLLTPGIEEYGVLVAEAGPM